MSDDMAYLARAFSRMCAEAIQSAREQQQRVINEAARHGLSGRMLLLIAEEYQRAATTVAERMVRHAYNVTGSHSPSVCDAVERALIELRDACWADLCRFFDAQGSWAPAPARKEVNDRFTAAMDALISANLDDMRHGFAGGTRLTKDPVVSVSVTSRIAPAQSCKAGASVGAAHTPH
jgi:hypothetical protein